MIALVLFMAASQPRLGVVDATPAGAPELTAAFAVAATQLGRFDVQPADAVDGALLEARKMGAACAFDDGPECWARLGILSELDRILVVRKGADTVDLLLVDVPARTAVRSSAPSTTAPATMLSALLSGQPTKPAPKARSALFYPGAYAAAFGAVLVAGCGGGALGVSSQMADRLVQARDRGVPLDDKYRGLDGAFVGLTVCAAIAGAAGVVGGLTALVVE